MLFRKKIDRYCTYCQFAGKIDDETMVCQFCGIVPVSYTHLTLPTILRV